MGKSCRKKYSRCFIFPAMKKNITLKNEKWTGLQKISFRFFFVFLTLQIITENFLGNLFGDTLVVWRLGEKIFVSPCLWLNHHLFHFKYLPESWTTFSGSLHTIRDTVYLLFSILICIAWTIYDKKRAHYNGMLYWFSGCLVVALSSIVFVYGIIKVFPVQMPSPAFINLYKTVGELSPFDLLWTSFGYGKPYQVFSGIFEVSGAILILFKRTRVAGLLIITAVMLNVIMLNYTYQIGVLVTSFYILLVTLFLLAPYSRSLLLLFFYGQQTGLSGNGFIPQNRKSLAIVRVAGIVMLSTSFILGFLAAFNRHTNTNTVNKSRQYSLVKSYVVNNDSLKPVEEDTTRWRIWSEKTVNGKNSVSIAGMKAGVYKTYFIDRDTAIHQLILHPSNHADTNSLYFRYSNISRSIWRLEGTINQNNITVELQKVRPDTLFNLLKTKRTFLTFDDDENQ